MVGAIHVSLKVTQVANKEVEVSKQSTNMPESPTFRGTAWICAGYGSCRASRTAHKEASAGTSLEAPHSVPFLGFTLESHPSRSQIRHADKVLNESPHCHCQ